MYSHFKQLLDEGCSWGRNMTLVRQLTLAKSNYWRVTNTPDSWGNECLNPEGGTSGWYITVSTTRVSKIIHVKCLMEFLVLVNAQKVIMITILFHEDTPNANTWNLPGNWVSMTWVVNGMDSGYGQRSWSAEFLWELG